MNLNKLFNFKYLLQNIKKSKMAILLFFIIVPVFTSLMIIAVEDEIFDFINLSCINMVGMYIIPFIFSVCLFGYVFKKNSVDFMGSMPISRKCIFITNTIGGIILIVLLQIITFLLTLLLGAITDCIIFPGMAFDVLIYYTVAYIFVFTIANLAMSVSGNVLTQIVVTLLITFLIPFSTWYVSMTNNSNNYDIMNYDTSVLNVNRVYNYTAPSLIVNEDGYNFNIISIYKMLVLIVIYFVLGLFAFSKRKMEIAGESFDNKYIHFIVKGLTLVPFVAILIAIDDFSDFGVLSIILAIIVVYYFIYDLITSKKMKFKDNIIGLVFSVLALYGTYSLLIAVDDGWNKNFNIDDVKVVEIERNNSFRFVINDKEKIKETIAVLGKNSNRYYNGESSVSVYVSIVRYGGGKYYRYVYVPIDKLSEILVGSADDILVDEDAIIYSSDFKLTKEEEKNAKNYLNNALKNMNYKELLTMQRELLDISLYEYKNHDLVSVNYPVEISKDLTNIIINAYNRNAYEYLKTGYEPYYYNINFNGMLSDEVTSKLYIALNYGDNEEISKFILNNYEVAEKDISKCILVYSSKFSFITDKVDEFVDVLNKIYEENKESIDSEYEMYYDAKYDDVEVVY